MSIKLEMSIDVENMEDIKGAISALSKLLEEAKPVKRTRTSRKKQEEPKQEEPKQEEPKQEEPKQEEPKQEELKPVKHVDLQDLRTLLSEKVKDNREAIKAKLTELGAGNLTQLENSKYGDMAEFLKGL